MTNCAQLNLPGLMSELASKEKESHDPHLCDGLDSGECANLKKSIANDIVALQNEIAFANEQLPICNLILGNWNINANGFTGLLSIEDLDTDGPLIAETFFGSSAADTIKGNWDNTAKKITFTRTISGILLLRTIQVFCSLPRLVLSRLYSRGSLRSPVCQQPSDGLLKNRSR